MTRFNDWRDKKKGTGKDLQVLIVLNGPDDLDETVGTLCKAAYGNAVVATSPPAWPGAAPILEVEAIKDEITSRGLHLVAIDGRGSAGKSTLAQQLVREWKDTVVVKMDDFRRPIRESVRASRTIEANTTVSAS